METFLGWGNSVNKAFERWRETQTRPVVAIATQNAQTLEEIITPEQIALGAGDDYLLRLNYFFATHNLPAYIRPLGEPNRCLNAWAGVECDGTLKGGEHSAFWYKMAFRRIVAIVRGGALARRPERRARRNRPAAAGPDQGRKPRSAAGRPGQHHLEPAARRLAARQRQLPRQLLAGEQMGRLGRDRLLRQISGLGRPQPLLRRQAVEEQAGRDHRVGDAGKRRTQIRQPADQLGRPPQARPDAHLLPGLRTGQHLRTRPLSADRRGLPDEDPPRHLPRLRRIQRRPPPPAPAEGKEAARGGYGPKIAAEFSAHQPALVEEAGDGARRRGSRSTSSQVQRETRQPASSSCC